MQYKIKISRENIIRIVFCDADKKQHSWVISILWGTKDWSNSCIKTCFHNADSSRIQNKSVFTNTKPAFVAVKHSRYENVSLEIDLDHDDTSTYSYLDSE